VGEEASQDQCGNVIGDLKFCIVGVADKITSPKIQPQFSQAVIGQ